MNAIGNQSCKKLVYQIWRRLLTHKVTDQAAKLSFYFFLSAFPFLLFLVALVGVLLRSAAPLSEALTGYLGAIVPPSASRLLDHTLHEISRGPSAAKISFGLVFALTAASKGMLALSDALNQVYSVQERRSWLKRRLTGLALTVGCIVLILAAFVLVFYGSRLFALLAGQFGKHILVIWAALKWLFLLAFVAVALNIIYLYAPNVKHRKWHWMMPGTFAGLLLWLTGSYGFKLYMHFFNHYRIAYGSIGAVIVLLLWFYITGIAILVGAEVNSAIESRGNIEEATS